MSTEAEKENDERIAKVMRGLMGRCEASTATDELNKVRDELLILQEKAKANSGVLSAADMLHYSQICVELARLKEKANGVVSSVPGKVNTDELQREINKITKENKQVAPVPAPAPAPATEESLLAVLIGAFLGHTISKSYLDWADRQGFGK